MPSSLWDKDFKAVGALPCMQEYIREHGGDPDDCEEKEDMVVMATAIQDKDAAKKKVLHASCLAAPYFLWRVTPVICCTER